MAVADIRMVSHGPRPEWTPVIGHRRPCCQSMTARESYDGDGQECSDAECPTCGRNDFQSRVGMKAHHARTHGESIAGEPVTCEHCGTTVYKSPSHIEQQDRHFCGNECQGEWMAAQPPENMPTWKGGPVEIECAWCGKTEPIRRARIERADRNFCSPNCHGEWKGENLTGERHPGYADQHIECTYCGESKQKPPSAIERYNDNFCDRGCLRKWASEAGEEHPLYRGGSPPYGPGFNEAKKKAVRERDGRECVVCGRSEDIHVEKFGRKHHVHHIQKARSFEDGDPAKNDMGNLLTVCIGRCHTKVEQMSPLRPVE